MELQGLNPNAPSLDTQRDWLLDWLTAAQLPRFNRKGVLRVVREVGLAPWLAGVEQGMLRSARERALRQQDRMQKEGICALVWGHQGYPHALAQLPDAPWILFVKGPLGVLSGPRPVAVVGTRRASSLGCAAVGGVLDGMAGLEWTLVSGMADGIDAAAHQAALERGVPTVACLAHGLHAVHPRSNARLGHRILESGGCWVSEYRLGTPPTKYTFPARNRIIAGLSQSVVVVESNDPGGSLITARLAQDYDRRVFALSPSWCAEGMKGNARLIQDQVAELLHLPEDLPAAMGWKKAVTTKPESEDQDLVVSVLDLYLSRPFDEVVAALEWSRSATRQALLEGELGGWVRAWPGDRFTRTCRKRT